MQLCQWKVGLRPLWLHQSQKIGSSGKKTHDDIKTRGRPMTWKTDDKPHKNTEMGWNCPVWQRLKWCWGETLFLYLQGAHSTTALSSKLTSNCLLLFQRFCSSPNHWSQPLALRRQNGQNPSSTEQKRTQWKCGCSYNPCIPLQQLQRQRPTAKFRQWWRDDALQKGLLPQHPSPSEPPRLITYPLSL